MAEWAYNPITGNLDRIGQGGGGGGNITITADSGPPLNGDTFAFVGQEAGASNTPIMDVDTSTGDVVYANNSWLTPYVVDQSTVAGLRGTYQDIQDAIDAAVLDGATLTNQKMVYIRYGTYIADLDIPPGIFLKGEAMYSQAGAVPLYTTIQGNHTLQGANLFRSEGIYFVNPSGTADLFTNAGATVLFNMIQCVLDNGASTGLILTSDFNFNQFLNCIFYGAAFQDALAFTSGMATFNFCSFPQSSGFQNSAALRFYDCSTVGLITNDNGQVFAYNTQFNGGNNCIVGTGATNLLHDCEFSCSVAGVDTPSVVCMMVNCYTTGGSGASLASASTLLQVINGQAGNLYPSIVIDSNYSAFSNEFVIMVDTTTGPVTITFAGAGPKDQVWVIKDVAGNAATNNITLQCQLGATIEQQATYVMDQNFQAVAISRWNGVDFVTLWGNGSGSGGNTFAISGPQIDFKNPGSTILFTPEQDFFFYGYNLVGIDISGSPSLMAYNIGFNSPLYDNLISGASAQAIATGYGTGTSLGIGFTDCPIVPAGTPIYFNITTEDSTGTTNIEQVNLLGYYVNGSGGGGGSNNPQPWIEVTGTSQAMSAWKKYIANNASAVSFSLPAIAAVGTEIEVKGMGAGGWIITQDVGQSINYGLNSTTVGASGLMQSTSVRDAVRLVCIEANTTWDVVSSMGNPDTQ